MFGAQVHRRVYILLLTLLGGCMVCSVWMANLAWVMLVANWCLEGRWAEKWQMMRKSKLLQAYIVFYLLMLVGMLWTEHAANGWSLMRVELPLLLVPMVVLTSPPLRGRVRCWVLMAYAATVVVVSVIGAYRLFTIDGLPYRDAVPYISHIRFALNCCMVVYLCVGAMWHARPVVAVLLGLLVVWVVVFLLLLHSYTAIGVLSVVSLVAVVFYWRRWLPIVAWVMVVLLMVVWVAYEAKSYYRLIPQATEPLLAYTEAGHAYIHANDGIVENGNYINNYICPEELRSEWNHRSSVPYDVEMEGGYSLQPTLVRYLNALGLTKDSVGVASLSDEQVRQVEQGVANPVYMSRNPVRKMVYVMLFEREYYVHTHAVKGFTMLQRIDLWRATAEVIRRNAWFGVGSGDVDAELHAELKRRDSEMASTQKRSHNQYLFLLAAIGGVGMLIIVFMFVRSLAAYDYKQVPLFFVAWGLTVLISFLTEDTLDTLPGILFCTYFLSVRPSTYVSIPHSAERLARSAE